MVILGICTLQYHKRTVDSLLDTVKVFPFAGWIIPDVCFIHIARDTIVQKAYELIPDFTHILFIDDDMCNFNSNHIQKLVENDKDIVSALISRRSPPYEMVFNFQGCSEEQAFEAIKNCEVKESELVGLAFTLIKRKVFDALREDTEEGPIWFPMDRWPRKTFNQELEEFKATNPTIEEAIFFGQTSHIGSGRISEDVNFCRRAKLMKFKCWVDCGVVVGHLGEQAYDFRDNIKCNKMELGSGLQV